MVKNTPKSTFITQIKLYGLDTRNERIHLTFGEDPFVGKSTDRVYATFTSKIEIPLEIQEKMVVEFNKSFELFREETFDLALTNYRDFNRKRVGFTFAYHFLSMVYDKIISE